MADTAIVPASKSKPAGKPKPAGFLNLEAVKAFYAEFPMTIDGRDTKRVVGRSFELDDDAIAAINATILDRLADAGNRRLSKIRMAFEGMLSPGETAAMDVRETGDSIGAYPVLSISAPAATLTKV